VYAARASAVGRGLTAVVVVVMVVVVVVVEEFLLVPRSSLAERCS